MPFLLKTYVIRLQKNLKPSKLAIPQLESNKWYLEFCTDPLPSDNHITLSFPGLKKILKVVGQIPEMPDCLPLTENTQLTASVLLNKLYDDLRCDPERDNYRLICEEYIK